MSRYIFVITLCLAAIIAFSSAEESGEGEQKRCSGRCFRNYTPVCASNARESRTFPNQCVLDYYNCQHRDVAFTEQRPGVCPEELGKSQAAAVPQQSSEESQESAQGGETQQAE